MNMHPCTQLEMLILKGPKINYLNSAWLPTHPPMLLCKRGTVGNTNRSVLVLSLARVLFEEKICWVEVLMWWPLKLRLVGRPNFEQSSPSHIYIISHSSRITTYLLFQQSSFIENLSLPHQNKSLQQWWLMQLNISSDDSPICSLLK